MKADEKPGAPPPDKPVLSELEQAELLLAEALGRLSKIVGPENVQVQRTPTEEGEYLIRLKKVRVYVEKQPGATAGRVKLELLENKKTPE